jgi:hypothetical protein
MAAKDNGMGPGKKPKAATKAATSPKTTSRLERTLTTVEKRGDTTFTKYPKQNGMQLTRIDVTKMTPKDTTKKK